VPGERDVLGASRPGRFRALVRIKLLAESAIAQMSEFLVAYVCLRQSHLWTSDLLEYGALHEQSRLPWRLPLT
jgi:hypothetical protein